MFKLITGVKTLFAAKSFWLYVGGAALIAALAYGNYFFLKKAIAANIKAEIAEMRAEFTELTSAIDLNAVSKNYRQIEELREQQVTLMNSLRLSINTVNEEFKKGVITEQQRNVAVSSIIMSNIHETFCRSAQDPKKCLAELQQ